MAKKKELSAEEQERYQKALGDFHGEGLGTINNQDKNFTYYLAAKDPEHPHNVERMKELGFEVVNRESNSGELMPRALVKSGADGVVMTRDMVLMRIDKDIADYRRDFVVREALNRSQAHNEELEEKVRATEGAEETDSNKKYFFLGG